MHRSPLPRRPLRRSRAAGAILAGVVIVVGTVAVGIAPVGASPSAGFEADTAFGSAGTATLTPPSSALDYARDLVVGADGKAALLTGDGGTMVRLTTDGQPDQGFAAGGSLSLPARMTAVAKNPDGSFILAGTTGSDNHKVIARVTTDGAVDTSVGTGGLATVPSWVDTFAVDGSGRVLVSGPFTDPTTNHPIVVVERFTSALAPDTTFGPSGVEYTTVTAPDGTALAATPSAIAVAPDGRILVAGSAADSPVAGDTSLFVARFLATGPLDSSYGAAGISLGGIPDVGHSTFSASDLTPERDGSLVLAGETSDLSSSDVTQSGAFLARYDPSGRMDPAFGVSAGGIVADASVAVPVGVSIVGVTDVRTSHTLLPDGTGGWFLLLAGYQMNRMPTGAGMVRFDPSGRLDPTFNESGFVPLPQPGDDNGLGAVAMAASPDGGIVVASTVTRPPAHLALPFEVRVTRFVPPPHRKGYWMLGGDGSIWGFGDAGVHGVPGVARLGIPWTHIEPTPSGAGYWVLGADGTVWTFGNAVDLQHGVNAAMQGPETAATMSATPSGAGYWIFTTSGRVIPYGDAASFGDMSATPLNQPIVDSVATPDGRGYYMVAADGGIFAFGDAAFHGSMGGRKLNAPVRALVPTADGKGYWLVAADGGIFAFGDAPFRGSMGSAHLNKPVTGMVRFGDGYLMVGTDGGIFDFSDLPFLGSLGANPPRTPVIAVAAIDT